MSTCGHTGNQERVCPVARNRSPEGTPGNGPTGQSATEVLGVSSVSLFTFLEQEGFKSSA